MTDAPAIGHIEALLSLRRYEEAESLLHAQVSAEPTSHWALCTLAFVQLELRRPRDAMVSADSAVQAHPDQEWPHRLKAMALIEIGAQRLAVDAADRAVAIAPSSWNAHYTRSRALLRGHDPQPREALRSAREALRLNPHDADCLNLLGVCLTDLDCAPEARTAFHGALRVDPQHALALANLGSLESQRGRLRRAARMITSGLAAHPQHASLHEHLHATVLMCVDRLMWQLGLASVTVLILVLASVPWTARAATGTVLVLAATAFASRTIRHLPGSQRYWVPSVIRGEGDGKRNLSMSAVFAVVALTRGLLPSRAANSVTNGLLIGLEVVALAWVLRRMARRFLAHRRAPGRR